MCPSFSWRGYCLGPPHSSGNSSLGKNFPFEILAFKRLLPFLALLPLLWTTSAMCNSIWIESTFWAFCYYCFCSSFGIYHMMIVVTGYKKNYIILYWKWSESGSWRRYHDKVSCLKQGREMRGQDLKASAAHLYLNCPRSHQGTHLCI